MQISAHNFSTSFKNFAKIPYRKNVGFIFSDFECTLPQYTLIIYQIKKFFKCFLLFIALKSDKYSFIRIILFVQNYILIKIYSYTIGKNFVI